MQNIYVQKVCYIICITLFQYYNWNNCLKGSGLRLHGKPDFPQNLMQELQEQNIHQREMFPN